MTNKKIILAGGTGFIGQALIEYFGKENDIIILTRNSAREKSNAGSSFNTTAFPGVKTVSWDAETMGEWATALEGADVLINLSGATINCRHTAANKKKILNSRIFSTTILGEAVRNCTRPPKLWINASTAAVYPEFVNEPETDNYNTEGLPFPVQVARLWEKTFFGIRTPFTRKAALRIALVLGNGGILLPFLKIVKMGMGGKQGSGRHFMSWVHIHDICRITEFIIGNEEQEGAFNCGSPEPVTNAVFMKTLQKATGAKIALPVPALFVKLGAWLSGTEPGLALTSMHIMPQRLLNAGFIFTFPKLENALEDIIANTPSKKHHLF